MHTVAARCNGLIIRLERPRAERHLLDPEKYTPHTYRIPHYYRRRYRNTTAATTPDKLLLLSLVCGPYFMVPRRRRRRTTTGTIPIVFVPLPVHNTIQLRFASHRRLHRTVSHTPAVYYYGTLAQYLPTRKVAKTGFGRRRRYISVRVPREFQVPVV